MTEAECAEYRAIPHSEAATKLGASTRGEGPGPRTPPVALPAVYRGLRAGLTIRRRVRRGRTRPDTTVPR